MKKPFTTSGATEGGVAGRNGPITGIKGNGRGIRRKGREHMLKYSPIIEYRDNSKIEKLSTTDPFNCVEMAVGQVGIWLNDYGFEIMKAEVQVYNNGKFLRTIRLKMVVDSWGRVKRFELPPKAVLGVKAG